MLDSALKPFPPGAAVSIWEHAARAFEPPQRRWATPGDLAQHLDARTVQTPALDHIDDELVRLADTPDGRLIISMPPQEGKSVRAAGVFPVWLLLQNPDLRVVTASYAQPLANRNGRAIRNRITAHPDLGLRVAPDNGSVSEWTIDGRDGGVLSVGVGAGVTGRPADAMIIDDPIKDRKEADSATFRNGVWDWWTDSASARLAPGAPVLLILTRWHHDDLAARLLNQDADAGWRVLNIPAQADHNPAKGETDPLGREPGEFMRSARGRTRAQWEQRKKTAGSRTWASLYQGRPTPDEGGMFPRDRWSYFDVAPWVERDDGTRVVPGLDRQGGEIIQSWDCTFKDTAGTDYVVGQVWMRRGVDCWLLDQVRDRMSFTATCQALRALSAKWPQSTLKLVEDKANGPAVISALARQVPGIVPEEPHGSKEARAAAVTPLVEAGNVHIPSPSLAAWVGGLVEEAVAFPAGTHDDQVDALSQALTRLVLDPVASGQLIDGGDLFDDDALTDTSYLSAFG